MDSQYAKNYQHFANIVKKAGEMELLKPKEEGEDKPIPEKGEDFVMPEEKDAEESKLTSVDDIAEQMKGLKIEEAREVEGFIMIKTGAHVEDEGPFSKLANKRLLENVQTTSKEMQLKFSNPIRDYCHLLSNRLLFKLISLRSVTEKASVLLSQSDVPTHAQLSEAINHLKVAILEVVAQMGKQLTYQKELRFIMQSDQKMKTAEREINRAVYAFQMLKDAGYQVN